MRLSFLIALGLTLCAAVASASVGLTLHWTAPGDDGLIGRATRYDIRYSHMPINSANFALATPVGGLPTPRVAGSQDSLVLTGLTPGVPYYFAIKTADEASNWSPMSNLLLRSAMFAGVDGPNAPLSLAAPWPNPAAALTRFAYSLPVASDVTADAFDITGRHVCEITRGTRSAGSGEFVWNLRDDSGRAVHSGVYLVRTRIAGRVWTHRVAITT